MRRHYIVASLFLAAACGGGTTPTGTTPPPPPPPTPGIPASVTIVAGDGQQALPGSVLPVRPAVLVKDAKGLAVPGVAVAFAVDSGGGSLASTTATTASDGMAAAGTWTLGAASGSNVVRVTVGSLGAVRIHAQALGPAARPIFANATLGAGGGTLTYTKPGDALNGLTITVPAGAYPTATTWSITADSTIVVPLPADFSQVGPVLIIGNGKGYGDSAITLTMPMHVDASVVIAPFYYDPVSRTLEAIPIIARSDTSAILATRHFSRDLMAIPGSGAGLRSSGSSLRADFGTVEVTWVSMRRDKLEGSFASTFQPGVDDWEFRNLGDYMSPLGDCEGMSITAMFYHYYYRSGPAPGPGLFHQFDQSVANQWDNVQGIRFAGSVQQDYESRITPANDQTTQLIQKFHAKGMDTWNLTGDWIALTLKLTRRPVLLALVGTNEAHAVVAYAVNTHSVTTTVSFADPNFPGQARTMVFASQMLQPVSMALNADEVAGSFANAYALGVTGEIPLSQIQTRYQEFLAKTAGSDRIPGQYSFITFNFDAATWGDLPASVYAPTGNFRPALSCPNCPSQEEGATPAGRMGAATYDAAGTNLVSPGLVRLAPGTTSFVVAGYAKSPYDATRLGFVDWKPVTVIYLQGAITPSLSTQAPNTPIPFSFQITPNTPPAHVTYTWDFGDGPPATVVTVTDNPAAPFTYTKVGTYTIKVKAVDPATSQVIATATTTVKIEIPQFAWQLTSVAQTDAQLPPGGIDPNDATDQLVQSFFLSTANNLISTPRNSEFFLGNLGTCQSVFLEVWPAGTFRAAIDSTGIAQFPAFLGTNGGACDPDHDFNATLTMGPLGHGTVIGSAVDIPKPESITVPGGSINATMNGPALIGTFTWRVRYTAGIAVYTFSFAAIQVLPVP